VSATSHWPVQTGEMVEAGGSIWLVADTNTGTLIDYHYRPHRAAGKGAAGAGGISAMGPRAKI